MAAALWTPLFSVFITQNIIGATLATVGIAGAIYSITRSFLQVLISRRLDAKVGEHDDFIALFSGIVVACFCSFSLLFVFHIWQLVIVQVLWGVADACTMAAYYSLFSHHIDRKVSSFEWSLFSVGGVTTAVAIGGLIGGFIATSFGFPIIFITAGSINILSFFFLIALYPQIRLAKKS